MRNISLFRDTAISHSNIDIRIVTKNIAIHRCTGVSLQPYLQCNTILMLLTIRHILFTIHRLHYLQYINYTTYNGTYNICPTCMQFKILFTTELFVSVIARMYQESVMQCVYAEKKGENSEKYKFLFIFFLLFYLSVKKAF